MVKTVPISSIRENPVALRTVNRKSEDYLGLVESMKTKGFMGAITVRERKDAETGIDYFELIDGLHRLTAAKDAGIEQINVDVIPLSDDQVLEAQIMQNMHKIETKPCEYSQQLKRLLMRNPLMTESELSARLGVAPVWIKNRLSLTKIDNPKVMALIDEGKIVLANAYSLAKLPPEEVAEFADRAITMPAEEFTPLVTARIKEINEARRKGDAPKAAEFQPVAYMQKMKDVKDPAIINEVISTLITSRGVTSPVEAAKLMAQWFLHLDPISVEVQKKKADEQRKAREEADAKRKAERAAKTAEKKKTEADEAAKAAAEAISQVK